MRKFKYAVVMSMLLVVAAVSAAFADGLTPVRYDDTNGNAYVPSGASVGVSAVDNGDFNEPYGSDLFAWTAWGDNDKPGWEVHAGPANLSEGGEGLSLGMSFFIRNTGGSGGAYAGLVQPLARITETGDYFVNISATAFWAEDTGPYNSVAWYAISDSATASGVNDSEWKELYRDQIVAPNLAEASNYLGRDEMVSIDPGQYFHVRVAQKFPIWDANTTFIIDDISVILASELETPEGETTNGYYAWLNQADADVDESCKWHFRNDDDLTCFDAADDNEMITWDSDELR